MLDFKMNIYIDETFKDGGLQYEMFWGKLKVLSYEYYRRRKKGIENPLIACCILLLEKIGFRPIASIRKGLSEEEKQSVSYIFPFINHYKGMQAFVQDYELFNKKYPYDTHDECNRLKQVLLNASAVDRGWTLKYGDMGTPFLVGCWDDSDAKKCIIVTNGCVSASNITMQEVCDAELRNEIPIATDDEKEVISGMFSAYYPDIQMRAYIEGDGKYIFRTCIASKSKDRVFELLAKSGLGNLADAYLKNAFYDLNLEETSPAMVFDMPMKLLRNINRLHEEGFISSLYERRAMAEAWKRFPELFVEPLRTIDVMWINYWHDTQTNQLVKAELLDKLPLRETITYLRRIIDKGAMNDYTVFACYENYIMYCLKADMVFYCGKYPTDLESSINKIIEVMRLRKEEEEEQTFSKVVNSASYQIYMEETPGAVFSISVPKNRRQLVEAGNVLHNCLSRYAIEILLMKCVIGLIYQRKEEGAEKKLIGAIEINNNSITQAKGVCNESLDREIREYVKSYAKRKRLHIKTSDLLKEDFGYVY